MRFSRDRMSKQHRRLAGRDQLVQFVHLHAGGSELLDELTPADPAVRCVEQQQRADHDARHLAQAPGAGQHHVDLLREQGANDETGSRP